MSVIVVGCMHVCSYHMIVVIEKHIVPCVIYNWYNPIKLNIATWCQNCFTHDSEKKWHLFRFFYPRSLILHSPSSGKGGIADLKDSDKCQTLLEKVKKPKSTY